MSYPPILKACPFIYDVSISKIASLTLLKIKSLNLQHNGHVAYFYNVNKIKSLNMHTYYVYKICNIESNK